MMGAPTAGADGAPFGGISIPDVGPGGSITRARSSGGDAGIAGGGTGGTSGAPGFSWTEPGLAPNAAAPGPELPCPKPSSLAAFSTDDGRRRGFWSALFSSVTVSYLLRDTFTLPVLGVVTIIQSPSDRWRRMRELIGFSLVASSLLIAFVGLLVIETIGPGTIVTYLRDFGFGSIAALFGIA